MEIKKILEIISRRQNSILWIGILLVLLLISNFLFFYIYHMANPNINLWNQGWNYFESSTFKIITASLILPILLFLLESIFNINKRREEQLQKEQEYRNQMIQKQEEYRHLKIEKNKEELIERQLETIKETEEAFNRFNKIVAKLLYVDNSKSQIEDILIEIQDMCGLANSVVGPWSFRFANLSNDDLKNISLHLFVLITCIDSVAHFIYESSDKGEIQLLKHCLEIINTSISLIFSMSIVIFQRSLTITMENKEPKAASEEIQRFLDYIKYSANSVQEILDKYRLEIHFLPGIEKDKKKDLNIEMERMQEFYDKDHKFMGCPNQDKLLRSFFEIPQKERLSKTKDLYSIQLIHELADHFQFIYTTNVFCGLLWIKKS